MSDKAKRVEELMKLPPTLCNTCGKCCKISIFKRGLNYEQIKKLAHSKTENPSQIDGAIDFLTIFEPFKNIEDAKKIDAEFCENIRKQFPNATFFHCRFIGENNKCLIHEDRPLLCRMYPTPHSRTFYFKGCGYKEQGQKNWAQIESILAELEQQIKK